MEPQTNLSKTSGLNEGNTNILSNVKSRNWSFTWNNYNDYDYENIKKYLTSKSHYTLGKEVGKNGTPHIQGYFNHKHQITLLTLKNLFPKVHWEKSKADSKANSIYCSKENYESNFKDFTAQQIEDLHIKKQYENVIWKDWQSNLINIANTKADSRTIYSIVDFEGNKGKSFLALYLDLHYNCIIADGKKDNIFNQIKISMDNNIAPKLILLDIPRQGENYLNYGVIEQIKNGHIYSGKYEGGTVRFRNPHIFIFSNFRLNFESMSNDRWIEIII